VSPAMRRAESMSLPIIVHYRYDGYGNRAEAGYLQIKGDKIYKDDGYGNKTLVGKVKKEKK
jgi:hypothetical protein